MPVTVSQSLDTGAISPHPNNEASPGTAVKLGLVAEGPARADSDRPIRAARWRRPGSDTEDRHTGSESRRG